MEDENPSSSCGFSSAARHNSKRSKNAPIEISTKKGTVGPKHPIFQTKKQRYRDPRFDDPFLHKDGSSPTFEKKKTQKPLSKAVERDYGFIFELRKKELGDLKQQFRKEADPDKKLSIKRLISRLENQERSWNQRKETSGKEQTRQIKGKQLEKSGKNAFFMKKGDKTLIEMAAKFQELKKSGKLTKYLERKRKKNVKADQAHVPE